MRSKTRRSGTGDLAELTRCVQVAIRITDAALPLPLLTGPASPETEHRMRIRELSFQMILSELSEFEWYGDAAVYAALEDGRMPPLSPREQENRSHE